MEEVLDGIYLIDVPRSEQTAWLIETDEPVSSHVVVGDDTILFGTGYGVFADTLIDQLDEIGGIDVVIIEHGDVDHYGAIAALVEYYDDLTIAMPTEDAPVLKKVYRDVTPDVTLEHDGVYWDYRAIKVPGHTAGNMSFLDEDRDVLIVGDSFVHRDSEIAAPGDWSGKFAPIDPVYNMKDDLSRENLILLDDYEFESALITHGEDVLENAGSEFDKLIDDLNL